MVKWGVLGTANIAKGCTIPGMKAAKNCELYAIAGRNEDKVKAYRDEFGFARSYVGYDKLCYSVVSDGKKTEKKVTADHNYKLEVEQLGRCIENNEKQHITPEFSIKNAKLLDMIFAEIEKGK